MQAVWLNPGVKYQAACVCEHEGRVSACACHQVASVLPFFAVLLLVVLDVICRHATCQCELMGKSADLGLPMCKIAVDTVHNETDNPLRLLSHTHKGNGAGSQALQARSNLQCTDTDICSLSPLCRNQLKHIQKIRYVADEAEQYERAWLLLADIYIQSGKFDLAQVCLLMMTAWVVLGAALLSIVCWRYMPYLQQSVATCNCNCCWQEAYFDWVDCPSDYVATRRSLAVPRATTCGLTTNKPVSRVHTREGAM